QVARAKGCKSGCVRADNAHRTRAYGSRSHRKERLRPRLAEQEKRPRYDIALPRPETFQLLAFADSMHPHARHLRNLTVFVIFRTDELRKLVDRHLLTAHANFLQDRNDIRQPKNAVDLIVELFPDLDRRASRSDDAVPIRNLKRLETELRHSRNL